MMRGCVLSIENHIKRQIAEPVFKKQIIGTLRCANREASMRPKLPLSTRLWAYQNGFPSEAVPLLQLKDKDIDKYLSYYQAYTNADFINGKHQVIHDHKLHWYYIFGDQFSDHLPDLLGYIDNGEFQSPTVAKGEFASLIKVLDIHETAVVKPMVASGGTNIHFLWNRTDGYEITGDEVTKKAVKTLESNLDGYIVTEFIEQAK